MRMLRATLVVILAGCGIPDGMRAGVGHRDEDFSWNGGAAGSTDYGGQNAWLEFEWRFKPTQMVMDYTPTAKLFLTDNALKIAAADHSKHANGSPVEVHVAGDETESEIGAVMDRARNPDGSFSWPGVVLGLGGLCVFGIIYFAGRRKP